MGAVYADEIGVAEFADGAFAGVFASGPEVASGKATKDGGAAGVEAFALDGVVDFLYGVAHGDLFFRPCAGGAARSTGWGAVETGILTPSPGERQDWWQEFGRSERGNG